MSLVWFTDSRLFLKSKMEGCTICASPIVGNMTDGIHQALQNSRNHQLEKVTDNPHGPRFYSKKKLFVFLGNVLCLLKTKSDRVLTLESDGWFKEIEWMKANWRWMSFLSFETGLFISFILEPKHPVNLDTSYSCLCLIYRDKSHRWQSK